KLGADKNLQIYGGPVAQRVQADVKLRGKAYNQADGYTAYASPDQDYGWIAGLAYSKPEIALKAALTYRSEIDHSATIYESFGAGISGVNGVGGIPGFGPQSNNVEIKTPKSVNF